MRVRSVLVITAILSSILGAAVVWLVLTVPNDIAAESLLKEARKDVVAHNNDKARGALTKVVQQYPRTDAAAAATVALVTLGDQERQELAAELEAAKKDQQTQIAALQEKVAQLSAPKPAPAPTVAAAAPPPAKPAVKKKAPPARKKKARPKRKRR